jgi:hypothetical protein
MSVVSLHSDRRPPPPVAVVVTSPRESGYCPYTSSPINLFTLAWARDEPPSPTEKIGSTAQDVESAESHIISDTSSLQSNRLPSDSASRWWSFTSRARQESFALLSHSTKPEKKSIRDISLSWMSPSSSMPEGSIFIRRNKEKGPDACVPPQVSIPTSTQLPDTATSPQNGTPRWDIPWSSPNVQGPSPQLRGSSHGSDQELATTNLSKWSRKTKQIRSFIIANPYAPLVRLSIISLFRNLH